MKSLQSMNHKVWFVFFTTLLTVQVVASNNESVKPTDFKLKLCCNLSYQRLMDTENGTECVPYKLKNDTSFDSPLLAQSVTHGITTQWTVLPKPLSNVCQNAAEIAVQLDHIQDVITPSIRQHGNIYDSATHYCVSSLTKRLAVIRFCDDNGTSYAEAPKGVKGPTHYANIKKCCPWNDYVSFFHNETQHHAYCSSKTKLDDTVWDPVLYNSVQDNLQVLPLVGKQERSSAWDWDVGFPNCSYRVLKNLAQTWFIILKDGTVHVGLKFWFNPVWLKATPGTFCVDDLPHPQTGTEVESYKYQVLFLCSLERFDDYLFHRRLFGGLCVTAALIMGGNLLIYLAVLKKQNMAAWTQFNIFIAVFFVFAMEGCRVLADVNGLDTKQTLRCYVAAALAQYFFLTLNTTWAVMCADLFWTFLKLESCDVPAAQHPRRLTIYFVISWIVPLIAVFSLFGVYYEGVMTSHSTSGTLAYAHRTCSSPIRELGFQLQGIFFALNMLCFAGTATLIYRHQRKARMANSQRRPDKNWMQVILFIKLLVIMGVTSLTLPFDYFFGNPDPLSTFSTILRLVHFIPVLAVFYIFGCSQRNLKLLKQNYPLFRRCYNCCHFRRQDYEDTDTNPRNHSRSAGRRNGGVPSLSN